MINLKRKEKFDKVSLRGCIYAGVAILGIGYELVFSKEVRPLLIMMYGIVVAIGVFYIYFLEDTR